MIGKASDVSRQFNLIFILYDLAGTRIYPTHTGQLIEIALDRDWKIKEINFDFPMVSKTSSLSFGQLRDRPWVI